MSTSGAYIFIFTSLSGDNRPTENEILNNDQLFSQSIDYNGLQLKHNSAKNIFIIDSSQPGARINEVVKNLKEEDYYHTFSSFLQQTFTNLSDIKKVTLLVHFGGSRPWDEAEACQKHMIKSQGSTTAIDFNVTAYSSFYTDMFALFSTHSIKKVLEDVPDGKALFEYVETNKDKRNLFKIEEEILKETDINNLPNIGGIKKIGIEEAFRMQVPLALKNQITIAINEASKDKYPKFLDAALSPGTRSKRVELQYLPLDAIIKQDERSKLFRLTKVTNNIFTPIIFIGLLDLDKDQISNSFKEYIDPRFFYFDSSIWCKYLSIRNLHKLPVLIKEIHDNYEDELYSLTASQEFCKFQKRLFAQSYVESVGSRASHGGMITPFSFHSEQAMESNMLKVIEGLKDTYGIDESKKVFNSDDKMNVWKWNILVYDDNALTFLNKRGGVSNNSKWKVICKNLMLEESPESVANNDPLNKIFERKISESLKIEFIVKFEAGFIDGKEIIRKHLVNQIDETYYDIVFLDYLFIDETQTQKYADEVIYEGLIAKRDVASKEKVGPLGKFWIFPISVYQNALADKLRNEGIPNYGGYTLFSEGGDPISTPQLFTYKLFQFLKLQLEEVMESSSGNTFERILEEGLKLESYPEIKKWARDSFSDIVELGARFQRLCEWKDKSAFANSALDCLFYKLKDSDDWYYIQNIFYLLAFESRSKSVQIVEDLFYLYKSLMKGNPLFNHLNKIILKTENKQ